MSAKFSHSPKTAALVSQDLPGSFRSARNDGFMPARIALRISSITSIPLFVQEPAAADSG
jgi:hypothetical protein